ncbi:hypothetical protein RRG08_029836 [Elysia crispata]|uniref:Caprin-1 dimerization domain-containing protein n=1 Tax=Elysia crispata TaxID=231223 RepID=A0AAE0YLY3_9GAST|nr:hypothetical protein RRG08_029836 [Elysia crispata]
MPTTTNVKVEPKGSPEMGVDATKQCINCLEKKVRNLEKRKSRIEQNQEKAKKGTKLEKEQEVSLHQYEQVTHDLEFARELHKQFQQIYTEHEKMAKKQAKREKAERQAQEIKRVSEILQLQSLLDLLGGDKVREDFKTGKHGAVVLSEDNLNQLDELYQVISPSREESGYSQRLTTAADHLVAILDGKDRQVVGTTYKEIKELITLISGCGYFEKLTSEPEPVEASFVEETGLAEEEDEATEEDAAASVADAATSEVDQEDGIVEQQQETATNEQQPIDLTIGTVEATPSQPDIPSQHPNTIEQDAFFGPSSTSYQVEPEPQFQQSHTSASSSSSQQVSDFQSFTNNRPFQFIQTSYIMPEVGADPAVIAAQPEGSSTLQFMSQNFESSASQQQQKQQPQQLPSQPSDLTPAGQQVVQQTAQPQSQDYGSQSFAQSGLHQHADSRYQPGPTGGSSSLPSHASTTAAANMIGESSVLGSHSPYEIPPSIPMPPSQLQDQNQLDQTQQRQQQQQKKFQMNASAPVFHSLYTQVSGGPGQGMPVSVPPPTAPPNSVTVDQLSSGQVGMPGDFTNVQGPPPPNTQSNGDYSNQSGGAGDFQPVYQGNGFSGGFSRGGRGGFRGGRGGSGGNGASRNGGPGGGMQNGFNRSTGGPGAANAGSRGGRGGSYQGYQPNTGYRSDGFQGGYNSGANSGGGGFGNQVYSKGRGGGMGGAGGQGGPGYNNRGGGGGNMGRGGAGGMRGGMPRGGGQGAPRGAPRSGQYSRTTPAQ